MRVVLQFGLALACAAGVSAAEQRNGARPPVARPAKIAGAPRKPKIGAPLSNPASPAARLYRASPEERDRALEKLPTAMQKSIRRQLETFDKMPKDRQQVWIRRAERFAALTPARKAEVIGQLQALGKMPQERRREVGIELRRLQVLPEDERQKRLASDDFKSRFSPEEQKVIADLSEVMLPQQ